MPAPAFNQQMSTSEVSQVDDLFLQRDAEPLAHARAAQLDEARISAAVARPSLTMKLPWVGDTRASPIATPLQTRPDRRARRPTPGCRPGTVRRRSGF